MCNVYAIIYRYNAPTKHTQQAGLLVLLDETAGLQAIRFWLMFSCGGCSQRHVGESSCLGCRELLRSMLGCGAGVSGRC